MAEIVAAALTSHAPLITGRPEVTRPDARDRPGLLGMFVDDHLQNFPYRGMPSFVFRSRFAV